MGANFDGNLRGNERVTYSNPSMSNLNFDSVRSFCASRDVDLVLVSPVVPFSLRLRGEFDGHGDFFSLLARDVEYVELAGGFTVAEMIATNDVRSLFGLTQRWSRLHGTCSGPAIAFRPVDSPDWEAGLGGFLIVANHFEWRAGPDWGA